MTYQLTLTAAGTATLTATATWAATALPDSELLRLCHIIRFCISAAKWGDYYHEHSLLVWVWVVLSGNVDKHRILITVWTVTKRAIICQGSGKCFEIAHRPLFLTSFSMAEHCDFWTLFRSFWCFFRIVSSSLMCFLVIFIKAFSDFNVSGVMGSSLSSSAKYIQLNRWDLERPFNGKH